jgi:hypothetical protein
VWCCERTEADREDKDHAGKDARLRQRKRDLHEGGEGAGAEVARGLLQGRINTLQRRHRRKDTERQQHVHKSDDDGDVSPSEADRVVNQPKELQDLAHRAVVLQKNEPPIGADHDAGHQR